MPEGPGTILGGLPVIAVISCGWSADTPVCPAEYYSEVDSIHWRKKDGTKGKELPEGIVARAEKYDPYFSNLMDSVFDHLLHEEWLAQEAARNPPA